MLASFRTGPTALALYGLHLHLRQRTLHSNNEVFKPHLAGKKDLLLRAVKRVFVGAEPFEAWVARQWSGALVGNQANRGLTQNSFNF